MASIGFTVHIPNERVPELRDLLAEVNKPDRIAGLARRARHAGYHRERMFLQPSEEGAFLVVFLELNDGVDPQQFQQRLVSYQDDFTAWWNPRFMSFFDGPTPAAELAVAWDDEAPQTP